MMKVTKRKWDIIYKVKFRKISKETDEVGHIGLDRF